MDYGKMFGKTIAIAIEVALDPDRGFGEIMTALADIGRMQSLIHQALLLKSAIPNEKFMGTVGDEHTLARNKSVYRKNGEMDEESVSPALRKIQEEIMSIAQKYYKNENELDG